MNRVGICIFFSLLNSTDLNAADHRSFIEKDNFAQRQAEEDLATWLMPGSGKLFENAVSVQQNQGTGNQDRSSSPTLKIESEGVVSYLQRITGLPEVLIRYELSPALENLIGQDMKSQERRDILGIKYAEIGFSTQWNNYIQNKTKSFWEILINKCDDIKHSHQVDWFFNFMFKSLLALDEEAFNARLTVLMNKEDNAIEIEDSHLNQIFALFFLESLIIYENGKVLTQEIDTEKFKNIIKVSNQFFLDDMNEEDWVKIITRFAQDGITSAEQIQEFAGNIRQYGATLFTDDMSRYDRARIIEGLSQGGIISAKQMQEFAENIGKYQADVFPPDIGGGERSWIISALLKSEFTSAEQIKSVISLFSLDMNRYSRSMIIGGLSQGGITSAKQIQEFARNIEKHKAVLFSPSMEGWDYSWVIAAFAKTGIISVEQMQGIAGQFNENMEGYARAMIIEGFWQGGITSTEQIQEFARNIEKYQENLFSPDMDEWDYSEIISALAKGRVISSKQIQSIIDQFNENINGWERAEIIRRLTNGYLI